MQTGIQIGAAAGTQVVDGVHNSLIAFISGNILPFTRFRCAVGKGNQCDKATCALAITFKKIDGRILGGSQTVVVTAATIRVRVLRHAATEGGFVILPGLFIADTFIADIAGEYMRIDFGVTGMKSVALYSCGNVAVISVLMFRQQAVRHRAGGIDDEHRCGLRVAGLGLGGRVHLHFQLDRVLVGVAGRLSGLADGINAVRQVLIRCAFSPATAFVIVANLHVTWRCLIRQHVQRQHRQGHDEDQDPGEKALANFLLRHKKILLLLPVRREEGGR